MAMGDATDRHHPQQPDADQRLIRLLEQRQLILSHVGNGGELNEIQDGVLHFGRHVETIAFGEFAGVLQQPLREIIAPLYDQHLLCRHHMSLQFASTRRMSTHKTMRPLGGPCCGRSKGEGRLRVDNFRLIKPGTRSRAVFKLVIQKIKADRIRIRGLTTRNKPNLITPAIRGVFPSFARDNIVAIA